jgi:hypothetical protein
MAFVGITLPVFSNHGLFLPRVNLQGSAYTYVTLLAFSFIGMKRLDSNYQHKWLEYPLTTDS